MHVAHSVWAFGLLSSPAVRDGCAECEVGFARSTGGPVRTSLASPVQFYRPFPAHCIGFSRNRGIVAEGVSTQSWSLFEGGSCAVHMLASWPSVSGSETCLSEQGFIDIGFLCPGRQYRDEDGTVWKSGGSPLPETLATAQACVEPLADVFSFVTGKTRSLDGKSIQDYTGTVTALIDNAGVIGWSFGGNLAVLAMARYGERFPGLRWYASWETPILGPVDEGRGSAFERNPFYDAKTGKIDFDRLRYSPEMPIWVWPIQRLAGQPDWPHGGLYLDGDGDRHLTEAAITGSGLTLSQARR